MSFTTDVYRMEIYGHLGGQNVLNVLHYRDVGHTGNLTPNNVANHFVIGWSTTYETDWLNCCPEDYILDGYKVKRINNGGGPTIVLPQAAGGAPGNRTGTCDATAIGPCLVAAYDTGSGWRTGRIFMPGVSQDDIGENHFGPTLLTALDTLHVDLLTAMTSTEVFHYVIWSPTHTLAYEPVTITTSGKPGVQNNRMKPIF